MPPPERDQSIYIDGDRALALIAEVVAEFGVDFFYADHVRVPDRPGNHGAAERVLCVYVRDGRCSCLIGHALHRAGVPIAELERMRGVIDLVQLPDRVQLTPDALTVFVAAQSAQDNGHPWGNALRYAREVLELAKAAPL